MDVAFRCALPNETEAVSEILQEANAWTAQHGPALWQAEQICPESLQQDVEAAIFYFLKCDGLLSGVFKILDQDPGVWPEVTSGESLFLHKVALRRAFAGKGLVSHIVGFSRLMALERNCNYLRLDCETRRHV